jgi:competence protein ComEC
MSQKAIAVLLAGFLGGVLLRSFMNFGWQFAGFFVFLGVVMLLISLMTESRKLISLIAIFLIAMALGMGRYEAKDYKNTAVLEQKIGQKITLEGVVIDEPDEREYYRRLVIYSNDNKILIYSWLYPEFQYGDKIKISGLLKKPSDLNSSFSWIDYLAKDDIYFEMIYPGIEFVSSGQGSWLKEKLFILKENFLNSLTKVIPEPHSAFMGGLTIGAKQSIPKNLMEDFRQTGIIHIVVLSGYNITLVADTMMKIFGFMPKILGIGFGALGIILFTIMTGASAATVRASIMALLVVLARATGRIYEIAWALFITAFFMILHNPKILRFDAGFQLSFLATLSLIILAPKLESKFQFLPKKFKIREITVATVSAQIFVLPVLLYKTGMFPIFSLPVNLLILIFVPITMFFGFLTGGLGMFSYYLSVPFGWLSYILLQYELWIVKLFS